MLPIYIPSRGRSTKQRTLTHLPLLNLGPVILVVPENELADYKRWWPDQRVMPSPVDGIAGTRDWILKHAIEKKYEKFVMLDDDLVIQKTRPSGHITDCVPFEIQLAFKWLESQLGEVAHAGFTPRFLSHHLTEEYAQPSRMMYVLGYNTQAVVDAGAYFSKGLDKYGTMEDFNMTLQLLTKGYVNRVSYEWRSAPGGSNAKGGCSTWRTLERQAESAKRLAAMYPEFVHLRTKKIWQNMGTGELIDVRVQWKKALGG